MPQQLALEKKRKLEKMDMEGRKERKRAPEFVTLLVWSPLIKKSKCDISASCLSA